MGLGLYEHGSGIEAAKFFIRHGARVTITDLKTKAELAPQFKRLNKFIIQHHYHRPIFHLGGHLEADFKNADLVIKNPGVRNTSTYLAIAKAAGVPIETDVSIFFKKCPAKIIGVTGTRGKSTTTALIYEILKTTGDQVFIGGNILYSPLGFLDKLKISDWVVLELSSWALESLTASPSVAVMTNIYPDHLNTYHSMAEYIAAKERIFKFQKKQDYLIINRQNKFTKKMAAKARSRVIFFDQVKINNPRLIGEHNEANIAAALAVARLAGVSEAMARRAIRQFKGLFGRLELVRQKNGIRWYNDTTATSPDGTLAALKTLARGKKKSIILICGGVDKNLPYQGFGQKIAQVARKVILLPGTATEKFKSELSRPFEVTSMTAAVALAKTLAKRGETVLLSPGAASLNIFKNEYDRGEQFVKAVNGLK